MFLNQFIPPDPAPTARLLGEVAEVLRSRGHEVILVGNGGNYHGGKTVLGSRFLREGLSLVELFFRALFSPRCDVIVCLSSPPLLPVVARLAQIRHRRSKLIHWAMDLYPEVAVALGEVSAGSLLHRITSAMMGSVYRSCDFIVVLDEEMGERIALHGSGSEVHSLWPPPSIGPAPGANQTGLDPSPNPVESSPRRFRWLYSGNLGRAHEWKTLLEAQSILERDGVGVELVFQGGGAAREEAESYANTLGLRYCRWQNYVRDEELIPSLLDAECLIVSQRSETSGCLWPSKLALARLLDRPIVWVGDTNGGVATMLQREGHFVFAPDESVALAERIKMLASDLPIRSRGSNFSEIEERILEARTDAINKVARRFEEVDWIPS